VRTVPTSSRLVWGVVASCVMLGAVWAGDGPVSASGPSKEVREHMAGLHEQMAACLRSDKSVKDCHTEMMRGCKQLGKHSCPMMGSGRHKHAMDDS